MVHRSPPVVAFTAADGQKGGDSSANRTCGPFQDLSAV
jgi:hypothetical protein